MTDETELTETEEERAVRLAVEAHRNLLADIDAEIERGRWFVFRAGEPDEEILTAEEFRIEADMHRLKGAPDQYQAIEPETLMIATMEGIKRGQNRAKAILAKIAQVAIPEEQGETERV